jgi:hypothetical protein
MTGMYEVFLSLHSLLRWLLLLAGLLAVVRAISGLSCGAWTAADERAGRIFSILFDVQFLVGLILYVALSPITTAAFSDFGGAMGDTIQRFFAVEHFLGMFVALALVHIGKGRTRKGATPKAKHKTALVFYGLALVIMLVSIPWPFMTSGAGRPFLRF